MPVSVEITSPTGGMPVNRTFQVLGIIGYHSTGQFVSKEVVVQFGPGGPLVAASVDAGNSPNAWQCAGTVNPTTPWGSWVEVTATARATFRFPRLDQQNPWRYETENASTTVMVRLPPAIPPTVTLQPVPSPVVAAQMPVDFVFRGTASSPQARIQLVQYKVDGGVFANIGNATRFSITLPLPPTSPDTEHTLTVRATDIFGTVGEVSTRFAVQAEPPIVIPPGTDTTFTGAPTTSSITSWTRLEPQSTDADMRLSSGARVVDALWMLTRQWQMGEFQAEDAGTPIQARVRATTGMLTRRHAGELPAAPIGSVGPTAIAAAAYAPSRAPLDVVVERRPMRAANPGDARMVAFAVEGGLHFLRMLELLEARQALSKSYRDAFLAKFALPKLAQADDAIADDATSRYLQVMAGRAPDGRQLAALLGTDGAAEMVADPDLNIAAIDRPLVQQAATDWLTWYDSMYSEPTEAGDDAWNPLRLEYAVSVAARLSTSAQDEVTFAASEINGPLDWSSFDIITHTTLNTAGDTGFTSLVEAVVPAPVTFPGAPARRFWEMEDARIAYGLVPVGPTDIAHLMMIQYASDYGNDWFVVPLTLPVGSVTRVDSLVVTDTFGVRSLVRPIGDPALPPPHFSLWQSAIIKPPWPSPVPAIARNHFFLPPTLGTTLDGPPLEDVLFMRDEMANLAWAIERSIESPIEQPAQRYEAPDAAPPQEPTGVSSDALPRYQLSSSVPPNWIPLLPVQVQPPNTPGPLSRLKRGAVLQPDGNRTPNTARGEVLRSIGDGLLYDEEVPREGARITRQRRLARWTDGSTWVWTSLHNRVGRGEGSSQLQFDRVIEPASTQA